jgi:fluoride exporter
MPKLSSFRASIAISLGAIAGALSRYYLGLWFAQQLGSDFPYGTFFINITGCFGMGFVTAMAVRSRIHPDLLLLLTTGFLGAYTTFSTYALDASRLLQKDEFSSLLYGLGSVTLGIIGIRAGMLLAGLLVGLMRAKSE